MSVTIGIINAQMVGWHAEPGEPDWGRPDYDTAEGWRQTLGITVEEYAATSPHMIVFELEVGEPLAVPFPPENPAQAEAWVRWAETEIGMGWHPDTSGVDLTTVQPLGAIATCQCGETFIPAGPDDYVHLVNAKGEDCGLKGIVTDVWGQSTPLFPDVDVRVRYDDGLEAAHRLLPDIYETSMRIFAELHPDVFGAAT